MKIKKIVDLPQLLERIQQDHHLLGELLNLFLHDYQSKRERLHQAVREHDIGQIKNIAHSLRGASANIAARALEELFAQLEDCADQNLLEDQSQGILLKIEEAFKEFEGYLKGLKLSQR